MMNRLKDIKQYQSASEDGPQNKQDDQNEKQVVDSIETDPNEFIDLNNIQNISELNQLQNIQKSNMPSRIERDSQSPIHVDNIAVDLDDEDLEQMQRIISQHEMETFLMQKKNQITENKQLDNYIEDSPPSGFENKSKPGLATGFGGSNEQIQNELRQLLAESSSEHLLMLNEENQNNMNFTSSEEQEMRRKWLHDNGLFSKEQSKSNSPSGNDLGKNADLQEDEPSFGKPNEKSIELGEQPVDQNNKNFLNENFNHDDQIQINIADRTHSNSPPLVTSKLSSLQGSSFNSQNPSGNDLQNFLGGSPNSNSKKKDKLGFPSSDHTEGKILSSPKEPKSQKKNDNDSKTADQSHGDGDENDSFHRLYNKEIKVNQDEIPLLLLELTDIAYKFIKKDQFEKAYVLLQKTESVLEVVNIEHSKRDRYFAYITYLNMAMCFQKLGMLEECIIYLKETIQVIEKPSFFKDVSISQRMKQMHMQCQLKLQLCAILSQTQKHTEAMDNAKTSVRLAHQILRDMYDLCVFYSNKIKFKDDFASLSLLLMEDTEEEQSKIQQQSKYYTNDFQNSTTGKPPKHTKSEINEKISQKQFIRENSPVRDIPFNILEESISFIERTALKMLPIMKELGNRLAGSNGKKGLQAFHTITGLDSVDTKSLSVQKKSMQDHIISKKQQNDKGLMLNESEEQDIKDIELEIKDKIDGEKKTEKKAEDQVDMRTVLGFLNQNEWILNLNIGNIMQIQPVRMRDFLTFNRNEHQLSRESFLEKLQLLVVSYFCVSTELRFIIQSRSGFMKAEVKKEKELEQEYWHVKALDIACAFLPSECPLFNHILLSYQKHHDPTMAPIDEDKEQEDTLVVLRPLKGIENSKYQPIVREVNDVYVDIQEIPMSPLSKCFDQRLMPKKVKTISINIQTDPIEQPELPMMKSQSISIQNDLKPKEAETITPDIFDANNAYMDLSSSKYQDSLISKIVDDPKIDKQSFLNKLITRVNSSEPDQFYKNNRSQGLGQNNSYFQPQSNDKTNVHTATLSEHPSSGMDDAIYGGRQNYKPKCKQGLLVNRTKTSQSGQFSKKKNNLDDLQHSFDHKSQPFNNHVRSLYKDPNSSTDATGIVEAQTKHHIASQCLAPSQNVFTEQKQKPKSTLKQNSNLIFHKKNQSISGLASASHQEMFTKTNVKAKQTMDVGSLNRNFNNSVNSNVSKGNKGGKKKDAKISIQPNKSLKTEKQFSNINLSNQKNQTTQKKPVAKYQNNINYKNKESVNKSKKGSKQKNEDSLIKELGDVMSSDYTHSGHSSPMSGADPDLQAHFLPSQMEDSQSELNKSKSNPSVHQQSSKEAKDKFVHKNQEVVIPQQQTQEGANQKPTTGKSRPSSAITNYTSGQSALRNKLNAKRAQQVQSASQKGMAKQILKLQQQQKMIQNQQQAKQKQTDTGIPIIPKKKSKVLSRKKYGSDNSSNSPPHAQHHGYSIAQGPFSIFDSGNSHSISKLSNMQQSKQSINYMQDQQIYQHFLNEPSQTVKTGAQYIQPPGLKKPKQLKTAHANSQTIQVKMKEDKKPKVTKQVVETQNQSENILTKLQNLLINKPQEDLDKLQGKVPIDKKQQKKVQQKPKQQLYTGQYLSNSNPRKQANSIGSLGYSQTRQSRYSQNSKHSQSRKSRFSRSKSSGKSKSKSNERSNVQLANKSQQDLNSNISPHVNQSQIIHAEQNLLDSDQDQRNQASFELNYLLNEFKNQQMSKNKKNYKNVGAQRQRPKSSIMVEQQRESLHKNQVKRAMGQKVQHNHSIENLQKQVLENQKILLSNMGVIKSNKQSKRTMITKHNHNNSISHVVGNGPNNNTNLLLVDESKYLTVNNPLNHFGLKPGAPLSSTSLTKKKLQQKKKESQNRQKVTQNKTSNMLGNLSSHQLGQQKGNSKGVSLKMTQQHLTQGFKHFMEGRGGNSTTASTIGAANNFQSGKSIKSRKQLNSHKRRISNTAQGNTKNSQFVNFEQMQQQLEGGVTLGGRDLQREVKRLLNAPKTVGDKMQMDQIQEQNIAFVPHKNLMPKTTGSQAHLLNIQQQQQQEAASSVAAGLSGHIKQFNSLNQSGRTGANNAFNNNRNIPHQPNLKVNNNH